MLKLLADFFHAPAVLPQVRVTDTGSGADKDDPVGGVEDKQAVIDKAGTGRDSRTTTSEIVVTATIWMLTAVGGFFTLRAAWRRRKQGRKMDLDDVD